MKAEVHEGRELDLGILVEPLSAGALLASIRQISETAPIIKQQH